MGVTVIRVVFLLSYMLLLRVEAMYFVMETFAFNNTSHLYCVVTVIRFFYVLLYRTNMVMNYSEVESKVREATNDDPWGPSGQLMSEIAR